VKKIWREKNWCEKTKEVIYTGQIFSRKNPKICVEKTFWREKKLACKKFGV
jgi:hypothetical protein